jgi:acyl-CoA reductase-like NAD-dependent aldehyde dehydrogenase
MQSKIKEQLEVTVDGLLTTVATENEHKRLDVLKTYKLYINGKFPRSESGRYYILKSREGKFLANVSRASRKDFRDAVVAARKAQPAWAAKSAYNRGQILYRMAEMLEGRKLQFVDELIATGLTRSHAENEVTLSIDRLVYYAGWSDKYQQVFSSVNPVESSHFNFSVPEPTGVVSILAPETTGLIGLISVIAPAIVGGNTSIVLASNSKPLSAITFAEALHSSDVPEGVVNILTGIGSELAEHFSSHMDVNATVYCGTNADETKLIQTNAANNVKRVLIYSEKDFTNPDEQNPYYIMNLQEIKTTWHPIGM